MRRPNEIETLTILLTELLSLKEQSAVGREVSS
jgi:hypothetical protein